MTKYWILIMIVLLAGTGCSSVQQAQIDAAAETVIVTAERVNDQHLELSVRSLCAAPLSSLKRLYGNNMQMVVSILATCGWSPEAVKMMTGAYVIQAPVRTLPMNTR